MLQLNFVRLFKKLKKKNIRIKITKTTFLKSADLIFENLFFDSVYDALTGDVVRNLAGHRSCVRDVSWHPYQPEIISSSVSAIIKGKPGIFGYRWNPEADAKTIGRLALTTDRVTDGQVGIGYRGCRG
jgi:hypothetical protein